MAEFYPADSDWHVEWFRKVASSELQANALVAFSSNGTAGDPVEIADASDTLLVGIGLRTVATTDSDYASNTRYPVLVPTKKGAAMFGTVGTGTLTVADEGTLMDLKDADEVDQSAASTNVLFCKRFISATEGTFCINLPNLN